MCGISMICEAGPAMSTIDRLQAMHARAAHRGPDGEGWLAVDADWRITATRTEGALREDLGDRPILAAAAFRWLRIQNADPASNQPMATASGRVWILFNGEIYNHDELRRALIGEHLTFRTGSDTEVFAAAYERWGAGAFARLNGMWAAIVIDTRDRSVSISRDRFGIRPLFYRREGRTLALGSEAKQVAALDGAHPRADIHAIAGFLAGRRPAADATYFTGVQAAPAASHATFTLDGSAPAPLDFKTYWALDPNAAHSRPSATLADASADLERVLVEAVGLQAVATVPVGALLSGGLDSSVLSALLVDARRRAGLPSTLVSVTAEGATGVLDERPFMQAMARALAGDDVTAAESVIDARVMADTMDRVTWFQEEPLAGAALVGQYHAFRAAAERGVRVVLDGTGSDELFGGYPRHQWATLLDHVDARRFWAGAAELSRSWAGAPFREWLLESAGWSVRRRINRTLSRERPAWLRGDLPATRGLASFRRGPAAGLSRVSRMTWTDLTMGNVRSVLTIGDRNAMAHSVESRVPYLDHRLVELAFALPDRLKVAHGNVKIVLREVARRRLPPVVAERRGRIGFGMPIVDWLRQSLRVNVLDAIHAPAVARAGVFNEAGAERFVTDFLDGRHRDATAVWRIFALARWLEIYQVAV